MGIEIKMVIMKRILFNNPDKGLFAQLKAIGLFNYYDVNDASTLELKGKKLNEIETDYIKNACFGDFKDLELGFTSKAYVDKYFDSKLNAWKSATVDITIEGIEILKKSGIKGWKII